MSIYAGYLKAVIEHSNTLLTTMNSTLTSSEQIYLNNMLANLVTVRLGLGKWVSAI